MTDSLHINVKRPRSRRLVFSSFGDHDNIRCWLRGRRHFDLWLCYYGDGPDRYRDDCTYYFRRKGGKFPNLHYAYGQWKHLLKRYDAIFVADDDIIIDAGGINRLFSLGKRYRLWLLQPAFDPAGKISHPITQQVPDTLLRYTNFIEVTCPLFKKEKLDAFMAVYDPVLVGWGVDYWFLHALGPDIRDRVAVVDAVSCINPHDVAKGGVREIDLLQDKMTRKSTWKGLQKAKKIPQTNPVVLGTLLLCVFPMHLWNKIRRFMFRGAL